jgi:hypothetical protein
MCGAWNYILSGKRSVDEESRETWVDSCGGNYYAEIGVKSGEADAKKYCK